MDGESPSQETSGSTENTDTNNIQSDETELEDDKDQGREPTAGEVEGHEVKKVGEDGEEDSVPEQGDGEARTDKQQNPPSKHVDAEENESKDHEKKDPKPTTGKKDREEEGNKDKTAEQTEETMSCKPGTVEEEMTENKKEEKKTKTEETAKEAEKDVRGKAAKGTEKKEQVKKVEVQTKDKGTVKEVEKQERPKRKSGPLSSLSRPRPSARSMRAAAKNDIIAKFQQGAPETPLPRNFKIQKSSTAASTGASIKQKMLQWCHSKTRNYEGVNIENFSSSWCDGLAFCALIHRFFPDAFDFSSLNPKEREKNFTLAFQTAESLADCCPLLEVSDMIMMGQHPDPMCVFTYVQSLCHNLSKIEKERRDKEKEDKGSKAGDEGESKEEERGEDEGQSAEDRNVESQEQNQRNRTETEGAGEEENTLTSSEMEGDGDALES